VNNTAFNDGGQAYGSFIYDADTDTIGNISITTTLAARSCSTYVERQNLAMRMHMHRVTRLTNALSKKIENHVAAISLHFMYYNFVRIHQTLRITPAMAASRKLVLKQPRALKYS
jgi:hypothetical protein